MQTQVREARAGWLERFEMTEERGYLPAHDPAQQLPAPFAAWQQLADDLPALLHAGRIRQAVDQMPMLDPAGLTDRLTQERAMQVLSYLGHAYVWGQSEAKTNLPAQLAVPWYLLARLLRRPPVLSYASYALYNWRRLDPEGPIELGNTALIQHFLGGLDEAWFILVHVDIEAKAGRALAALERAQAAAGSGQADGLLAELTVIGDALDQMYATLQRMPEGCDPYVYYHRVRPYLHGWRNHPLLPNGVVYEGVDEYRGRPQQFRGETGAQSGIVPALDAAFTVRHADDPMRPYLLEMRHYMPPAHRAFVEALEDGASVRAYIEQHRDPGLIHAYNRCVGRLGDFRALHLEYAGSYIQAQAQHDHRNPNAVGTGGTPFIPYLKKHQDETYQHLIR